MGPVEKCDIVIGAHCQCNLQSRKSLSLYLNEAGAKGPDDNLLPPRLTSMRLRIVRSQKRGRCSRILGPALAPWKTSWKARSGRMH
jgi:hypothetical protein